jgi:hypothetical protein
MFIRMKRWSYCKAILILQSSLSGILSANSYIISLIQLCTHHIPLFLGGLIQSHKFSWPKINKYTDTIRYPIYPIITKPLYPHFYVSKCVQIKLW